MGKIVMPKNSADLNEVLSSLEIYYNAGTWLDNGSFKSILKAKIGAHQYPSSYTKKTQILSYYGFVEWEDITRNQSSRRITPEGKIFWEAWQANDTAAVIECLVQSLERTIFGRDNFGCPDSDSDIDPPCLLIRAILDLGYITPQEYSFLLWSLNDKGSLYTDSLEKLRMIRRDSTTSFPDESQINSYLDNKPKIILERLGMLTTEREGNQSKTCISPDVLAKYKARLQNLKIYNVDKNTEELKTITKYILWKGSAAMNFKKHNPRVDSKNPLNLIVYGAPGTGKTFSTASISLAMVKNIEPQIGFLDKTSREQIMKEYNSYIEAGRIVFTTFHQSYSYEDFIEGLKPAPSNEGNLSFSYQPGVFLKIASKAMEDPENNYVFIIDEINRGNISKIFGELITLIEPDKRYGEINAIKALLPSGAQFAIPNNLYILGTMNSADKSISILDVALRRRFDFLEMPPVLDFVSNSKHREIMKHLNEHLRDMLESTDLLIGHSYFMDKTDSELAQTFNRDIIPLLYEYFYDDQTKVTGALNACLDSAEYALEFPSMGRVRVKLKMK